ncbi:WG repeat-containing protein [Anaerosinus sp.]
MEFDEVPDGYNGFISAKKDNKWGFIDKTGNMVIEPQYEEVGRFFNK